MTGFSNSAIRTINDSCACGATTCSYYAAFLIRATSSSTKCCLANRVLGPRQRVSISTAVQLHRLDHEERRA